MLEDRPRIKYAFDVKDVQPMSNGAYPKIWVMKEEYQSEIVTRIKEYYDNTESKPFIEVICTLAEQLVKDQEQELRKEFVQLQSINQLEKKYLDEICKTYLQLLQSSVAYCILSRCGIAEGTFSDQLNFRGIEQFNTMATLSELGNTIVTIVKPILMLIGKRVFELDNHNKKSIANAFKVDYNALKRESENTHRNIPKSVIQEGRVQDDNRIHESRGISSSEFQDRSRNDAYDRKVWKDEDELSSGTSWRNIPEPTIERRVNESSESSGRSGTTKIRYNYGSDEKDREYNRGVESNKSVSVDSRDESNSSISRGDSQDRDYIQLNFFPSIQQQKEIIKIGADEEKAPIFMPIDDEPFVKHTYKVSENDRDKGTPFRSADEVRIYESTDTATLQTNILNNIRNSCFME